MAEIKEAKLNTTASKDEPVKDEVKSDLSPVEPKKENTEPEDAKDKEPVSPVNTLKDQGKTDTTPKETPSIATIDRMRAREDTPVRIDPKTIGKIRSPNFAQFKTGLGSVSAKKLRQDLEMSGTPTQTPTKNRYAPQVEKADFELDICAKIGAIKWDSDSDD